MCSAILLEVLHYYTNINSSVYVLYLDASKAFDRLCHAKLLQLLQQRKICPLVLRFLHNLYSQYMGVLGYADDLAILSPSLQGLKHMVKICEQFAI